jgi:20S proteasome subunit alpha 6
MADKHQKATQSYVRRPYGVGLLVASYDRTGPHLLQTCPSGNYYEWRAMAIGARSQSGKTYLEKKYEGFPDMDRDQLIKEALTALQACTEADKPLTTENTVLAVVGKGERFHLISGAAVGEHLQRLERPAAPAAAAAAAPATGSADIITTDRPAAAGSLHAGTEGGSDPETGMPAQEARMEEE